MKPPSIPIKKMPVTSRRGFFSIRGIALFLGIIFIFGYGIIFVGTTIVMEYVVDGPAESTSGSLALHEESSNTFPIGVNPRQKLITENPDVDTFFDAHVSESPLARHIQSSWFTHIFAKLTLFETYQNLASPTGRILVIQPGERKEEIASHFGKILHWDAKEKEQFLIKVMDSEPAFAEGKFAPSTYTTGKDATPEEVAKLVSDHFNATVASRYSEEIELQVPLKNTLVIASMIEREAYDFNDMRYISGIMWNRLFSGMKLQIDATLQYARGSESPTSWWPKPVPKDKYVQSPFNTYQNKGLPPEPIANPSLDAILAALNPRKTDCMYYFHDKKGGFHCSVTYEEHVASLKEYYGRGK